MGHRRQRALIYSPGIRIDRNCIDRSQHCWDSVNTQAETFDRVSPNNMGIGTLGRGQPDNSHRALQKFALYLVYRQVWPAPELIPEISRSKSDMRVFAIAARFSAASFNFD